MGLPDIENIPESGAVFTIGRSRFADNVASHFFIRKDPVVTIACGDEHSAVVCQSGRLFVFGSNDWGQLGLGHKNHVSKPSCVKILKPEKVTHVACGRTHTLICTGGQKIFACGSDQEGQLGRGSSAIGDSASSPVLVYDCGLAGPRIVQIAAGSHHSMALTSDGGVVAWGSNLEGQLGLVGISGLVNKPTKVPIPETVKAISAGYYHSAFLTENGHVYVCGESESGKLGIDVNFSTQVAPKQMQLSGTAVQVSCGGHHTFILAENGELYCAGSNASGQLGIGADVTEVQTAKLLRHGALENETVVKAVCGESHSAILTESGKLFTCGDGRHGKLGLEENENNVHDLTYATKYQELFVSNVACGGCHTILVGRRRDINRQAQSNVESIQMTHGVQKKNPLPPLKLPVNRLQNDARPEKMDETDKIEIDKSNKTENSPTTENTHHTEHHDKKNSRENSAERNDSINNNKYIETPSEGSTEAPTQTENDNEKTAENNADEVSKLDSENNVKEEEKVEKDDADNGRPLSSDHSKNVPDNPAEEKVEEKQPSPDKPSSPSSVPPPKPPRQKIGSPDNSEKSDKSTKSISRVSSKEDEIAMCDPKEEENNNEEKEDKTDKTENEEDGSPAKKSAASRRSRASNHKTGIEEIVQSSMRNPLEEKVESVIDAVKTEVDNLADDADVIQSPAPRTGKMAKLFRGKRQQEIENGTRKSGNAATKAKSKTCTVL